MACCKPTQTAGGRTRATVLGSLAIVSATVIAGLGFQSLTVSPSSATSPILPRDPGLSTGQRLAGLADGVVPDGVTVFDDQYPAVAKLDPTLLRPLRQAAQAAAGARVEFYLNSGWRSPKYQQQLLDEAVSKYGSKEEAARWVGGPTTSAHVSGNAVDIGPTDATAWLFKHGSKYGLCQIYRNEPWHYELRGDAIDHGCPRMYADPTQDPRMQR